MLRRSLESACRSVGPTHLTRRSERTHAELERIQSELKDAPGALGVGIDVVDGQIDLRVIVATLQEQARLDETYGTNTVRLTGALIPLR